MMKMLQINRAKPNPTGKDKGKSGTASAAQLGGEWVDILNIGDSPISLDGVSLYHIIHKSDGTKEYELVVPLIGTLGAKMVLRVHSGSGPESSLHQADLSGAHYHGFTGRDNYVWNNDKGDSPLLYEPATKVTVDSTYYDPRPTEGFVLYRVGPKLQPV